MMKTKDKIIEALRREFDIHTVEVEDLSFMHQTHKEAKKSGGGHYHVFVISKDFEGKTLLERHKLINKAVLTDLKKDIHALGIKAVSTKEFASGSTDK